LSHMPSIAKLHWRQRALTLSICLEVIGAFAAMGEAFTSASYGVSVVVLLAAFSLFPFVDKRAGPRHERLDGVTE